MSNNNTHLNDEQLDTIGEIMNISMGSAATALSTMLDRQVSITTPKIVEEEFGMIESTGLEPAIMVKIEYVQGIDGTNVTMIKKEDMQIMLDILMGNEDPVPPEEFEFDDMSMSAASEIMNQMMGSSATALSQILEKTVDISTPHAVIVDHKQDIDTSIFKIQTDEPVVAVSFDLTIVDALSTEFMCFLQISLAKKIIATVNAEMDEDEMGADDAFNFDSIEKVEAPPPEPTPAPVVETPVAPTPVAPPPVQTPPQQPMAPQPQMQQPQAMPQGYPQGDMSQNPYMQNPYMPNPYMQNPYMNINPYMQNPYMQPPQEQAPQEMANTGIKNPTYPNFAYPAKAAAPAGSNLDLLMGVELEISIVIGRARQKIKDIMDMGQGTVLELDKQTGSPAEIIVNGKLLAYGDVIVVGDNFGIRITEIVGTKELLDSLNK